MSSTASPNVSTKSSTKASSKVSSNPSCVASAAGNALLDPGSRVAAGAKIPLGQCMVSALSAPGAEVCRHCGGSGMLRVSDLSYRTCMDCLGLGKLAPSAAAAWGLHALSGSVCASGAR